MADNDQAQADLSDSTPPGDNLATQGASHDPEITGATNLADYQAMVDDLGDDEQGDEPAESEDSAVEEGDAGNGEEEEIPAEETEDAVEEEPESEPKSSNRFRFNSPEDQAVAAIAKAKGVSLVEAARIFAAESAPAAETAPDEEAAPVRTLADVEAEYAATRAERKAAMAGLEIEKAADLDDKLEDLRDEREALRLAEATAGATRESAEEARFFTEYEQAEAKAVAHYPDTTDPESALTKRMVELDQTMKRLGDPLFHSPNKPFLLAQKAAIELGIPMTDPKAAKPAATTKVTRRPVPPASGNARTTAPADSATKLEKAIGSVKTADDYENLVAGLGVGGL